MSVQQTPQKKKASLSTLQIHFYICNVKMKANELYEVYDKLKVFCFQSHVSEDARLHGDDQQLHN